MRTPPTNSPPSSGDERSPPPSPHLHSRNLLADLNSSGVMTQVNEFLSENPDGEQSNAKKKNEERDMMLAAQAENEKLLDKDWRDGMFDYTGV